MNIGDDIMQLIIRHLSNTSSNAEDVRLEEWLGSHPANRGEFEKIRNIWTAAGSLPHVKINVDSEWHKFRGKHFSSSDKPKVIKLFTTNVMRYAAAAVIVLGIIAGSIFFTGGKTYTTGSGERLLVNLDDGTNIILGSSSELTVPYRFNRSSRSLDLNGEGFFEVAKNPEKPFIISSPLTTTKVLGTAFKLRATQSENSIVVSEGKVAYWSAVNSDTLILQRGDKGTLKSSELFKEQVDLNAINNWKGTFFTFKNINIMQVLSTLQDHYVFNIADFENFNDLDCAFTGTFKEQSLTEILDELSQTMGMSYTFNKNELRIGEFNCN